MPKVTMLRRTPVLARPKTLRDQIRDKITEAVLENNDFKHGPGNNLTTTLLDLYVAQEMEDFAAEIAKKAWKDLETKDIVDNNKGIRDLGTGEHTIANGKSLIAVARVSNPPLMFDKDKYVALVAKRFKLDAVKLTAMLEDAKVEGTAAVGKRIVEVS